MSFINWLNKKNFIPSSKNFFPCYSNNIWRIRFYYILSSHMHTLLYKILEIWYIFVIYYYGYCNIRRYIYSSWRKTRVGYVGQEKREWNCALCSPRVPEKKVTIVFHREIHAVVSIEIVSRLIHGGKLLRLKYDKKRIRTPTFFYVSQIFFFYDYYYYLWSIYIYMIHMNRDEK